MTTLTTIVTNTPTFSKLSHLKQISIWDGSTFELIRTISSPRAKGAIGEKLTSDVMTHLGHVVTKPSNSGHDRIIDGYKTEIKLSTTWDNRLDTFTWQQIRNQDYDRIIFIGVNPYDISFYWAEKSDLVTHIFGNDHYRQHAGKNGGQDLYWIQAIKRLPWFRDIQGF